MPSPGAFNLSVSHVLPHMPGSAQFPLACRAYDQHTSKPRTNRLAFTRSWSIIFTSCAVGSTMQALR